MLQIRNIVPEDQHGHLMLVSFEVLSCCMGIQNFVAFLHMMRLCFLLSGYRLGVVFTSILTVFSHFAGISCRSILWETHGNCSVCRLLISRLHLAFSFTWVRECTFARINHRLSLFICFVSQRGAFLSEYTDALRSCLIRPRSKGMRMSSSRVFGYHDYERKLYNAGCSRSGNLS